MAALMLASDAPPEIEPPFDPSGYIFVPIIEEAGEPEAETPPRERPCPNVSSCRIMTLPYDPGPARATPAMIIA